MDNILFDVSSDIVIITGVCGQLGNSYANAFLLKGARVVGLDKKQTELNKDLENFYSEKYFFCESDVTSKDSLREALKKIEIQFGI